VCHAARELANSLDLLRVPKGFLDPSALLHLRAQLGIGDSSSRVRATTSFPALGSRSRASAGPHSYWRMPCPEGAWTRS
jgi:hypothetical protein